MKFYLGHSEGVILYICVYEGEGISLNLQFIRDFWFCKKVQITSE